MSQPDANYPRSDDPAVGDSALPRFKKPQPLPLTDEQIFERSKVATKGDLEDAIAEIKLSIPRGSL